VHQHTKDWSATIERADAFVFVMPEYNYGFNAPLKNALDYVRYRHTDTDIVRSARLQDFLRQAKDEVSSLNEGYRQLEQILRDSETER